ncbi:hypothetical protein FDJ19_gp129 [Vibrio phage Ceto]|uniref:Uncharacterized protein n=1 Tax=Vibrio phage Ceto TaxID=2570300 RepID=A0A2H5BGS8_9CAUD|nr:hypothetical protein FDJ19_gp129 [Vibrio phage Ceto]AUG85169.1 hypothetical protein CETO_187 [Vibrio phage Ceto]
MNKTYKLPITLTLLVCCIMMLLGIAIPTIAGHLTFLTGVIGTALCMVAFILNSIFGSIQAFRLEQKNNAIFLESLSINIARIQGAMESTK